MSDNYRIKIKDMPFEERPRERLSKYGPKALSNSELLAIILGNGSQKENALELAGKLLKQGSIMSLSRKRLKFFKNNLGIGDAKATKIIACFELGRRLTRFKEEIKPKINNAKDIAKLFIPELSSLKKNT